MASVELQRLRGRIGTLKPPPRVGLAVRAMLAREGEAATVQRLQVSRETALRLAALLPCRRGSILVAARALGIEVGDAA